METEDCQAGNMRSWGHSLPTQNPELTGKGKAPAQAGQQVRLWYKVSFTQVVGKEELTKKKRGLGIYPSKIWQC